MHCPKISFTYRYIDDVLSLNNSKFSENVEFVYPREFELLVRCLNDYCTRWCKREHIKPNALNNRKLNIFQIIGKRTSFYSNNLDFLPTKSKFSFRHLKQGIQEFSM